jgi:hypothetical protein
MHEVFAYIKKTWGMAYYLPSLVLIVLGMVGINYDAGQWAILAGLAWLVGVYGYAASMVREDFMRKFATTNGFNYVGEGEPEMMLGNLFQKGNIRSVKHIVEGESMGHKVRFFFYSYTVGIKNKKTYSYSVSEIFFKGIAPDIVIESRSDWDFISYVGNGQKEMPVEGFFKKHFGVFVPEDFEIETLELLTPDVMEHLINHAKKYNFEFIKDRLYVFKQGVIVKDSEMNELLVNTKYIIDKLAPKLFRLQDDILAMKKVA